MPTKPQVRSTPLRIDAQIIGATLLIKALLFAFGVVVVMLFGTMVAPDASGGASRDIRVLLEPWTRWDAPHYTDLAAFGYRASGGDGLVGPGGYVAINPSALPKYLVFFPLYPALIAAVDVPLQDPDVAALVVSGFASLIVGPLLLRLVAMDEGPIVARRSVLFLLIFPTAYFLHIGYAESLFLALALGSMLAARRDWWWLSGVLGAFAALARINGLILVPALIVEAVIQWRQHRQWRWAWISIGLIPLGFAVYLGLNTIVLDDPFAFIGIQAGVWDKSLSPPWVGIGNLVSSTLPRAWIPELAFVGLGLVGTIVAARRFRPTWTVWMAGNLLMFTSTSLILSVPRYSLTLFPLFVWFALLARSRALAIVIAGLSGVGLAYFAGRFALGAWAF